MNYQLTNDYPHEQVRQGSDEGMDGAGRSSARNAVGGDEWPNGMFSREWLAMHD